MDPNATLERIRALIADLEQEWPAWVRRNIADDLAQATRDLDTWIGQGGFLPDDWAPLDAYSEPVAREGSYDLG